MARELLGLFEAFAFGLLAHQVYKRVEPDGLGAIKHGLAIIAVAQVFSRQTGVSASLLLLVFVTTLFTSILVYRAVPALHPLGRVVGPRDARLSQLVAARHASEGTAHLWLKDLHAQYGNVVRWGPNAVSVKDPANLRRILTQCTKHAYYWQIGSAEKGLFREPSHALHRQMRLVWSQAFQSEAVQGYLPLLRRRNKDMLKAISKHGSDALNVHRHIYDCAFFVALDLGFGDGRPAEEMANDGPFVQHAFDSHNKRRHTAGMLPWIGPLWGIYVRYLLPERYNGSWRFGKYAHAKFKARREKEPLFRDVFYWLLSRVENLTPGDDSQKTFAFTEKQLGIEASLVIAAGSDTSSITMACLMYELIARPECLLRLRKELETAFPAAVIPASLDTESAIKTLLQLPYLDACINEALRLDNIGPLGAPRLVPSSGLTLVDGTYLPPNTRVQVPMYASSTSEEFFSPEPEAFRPERWLESESDKWNTIKEGWYPFSFGPRSCAGREVAMQEMVLVIASLVVGFEWRFAPGYDAAGFKSTFRDHFLLQFGSIDVVATPRPCLQL